MGSVVTSVRERLTRYIVRDVDRGELLRGATSAMGLKVLGLGGTYFFNFAVIRTLGAASWGVFALCLALVTLASIVGRLGLDTVALRLIAASAGPHRRARVRSIVARSLACVLPACVAVGILAFASSQFLAAEVFGKPQLSGHFRIASFGIPALALSYFSSQALRGLKQIREYVFFDWVARFLIALVVFPFALAFGPREFSPIIAFVIGLYIVAGGNYWILGLRIRHLAPDNGAHLERNPADESTRGILLLGLPLLLASSVLFLNGWIDTLMLGVYVSEAEVGIYHVALKVAALVSFPLLAINTIAAPKFAESYAQGEMSRLASIAQQSASMIATVSLPLALFLWVAGPAVMGMFGDEVRLGFGALAILVAGSLVNAVVGPVGVLLQMTGLIKEYRNITIAVLITKILGNVALIPALGIEGAALSTASCMVAWNVGFVLVARVRLRIWPVRFFRKLSSLSAPDGRR